MELTIENLQAQVAELTATNEKLATDLTASKAELDQALAVNTELTAAIAEAPVDATKKVKSALSDKTFKVDGKTYGFAIHAVHFEGQVITNADVLGSKDLQKKLVEFGSSMIKQA